MRLQGAWNSVRKTPGRYVVGFSFLALIYWGLFVLARRGVRFIDTFPEIGSIADAVMQRSMEGLFTVLIFGVVFSVLTTAVTTLYSSEDLPFLLGLPIPAVRVFNLKVSETYLNSALLPSLFTVPMLVGLGVERQAPWFYYATSLLAVLALYAIPVALGAVVALLLVRIAPAGRVKETATALSVLFAAGLIVGLRALRPEQLVGMSLPDFERLLSAFADVNLGWLPPSWASDAVLTSLEGSFPIGVVLLAIVSLLLLAAVARMAAYAYREGWIRSLDTQRLRLDATARKAAWWERPLSRLGKTGGLVIKDNRMLMRDPTQWSQLLVLIALAGVYLVSTSSISIDLQRFRDALGAMNLLFLSFLLAGVGIRTAYPIVSLEGEGFWLLQTGPLRSSQIVLAKFFNALPIMVLLGGGLGFAAARLIDVSPNLAFVSPIAGVSAGVAITGLGVGLGAAFPRFGATNPAEIPLSAGGLVYMILSFAYAAVMTLVLALPAWRTLQSPDQVLWTEPTGLLVLAVLLLLTTVSTAAPLIFGTRRLSRFELGLD